MVAEARSGNLYLYGCTAKLLREFTLTKCTPFGREAVVTEKFALYLPYRGLIFCGRCMTHRGPIGLPHRTLPQVYRRIEERMS